MKLITYNIDENGCHICTSHEKGENGYPAIKRGGRCVSIMRWLWSQKNGTVPEVIRHTCDNRACINLDHAIAGTHADNVADRVARGRSATGTANGRAKLTEKDVREILASPLSAYAIAKQYGVDGAVIRSIRSGKTWKHVERPTTSIGA